MSKLLVSLLFAACLFVVFTSGSSIYRDQPEDNDFMYDQQNDDEKEMLTLDAKSSEDIDESENKERDLMTRFIDGLKTKVETAREYWNEAGGEASKEKVSSDESDGQKPETSLLSRGMLDKVSTGITNAGNKAKSAINTAKAKAGELKDKASKILGTRTMDKLEDVMKRYMGTMSVSEDDILNFLKKRQEYRNTAQKSDELSE